MLEKKVEPKTYFWDKSLLPVSVVMLEIPNMDVSMNMTKKKKCL